MEPSMQSALMAPVICLILSFLTECALIGIAIRDDNDVDLSMPMFYGFLIVIYNLGLILQICGVF